MATKQLDLEPIAGQMEVRQPTALLLMQRALELGQVEQLQILQEMHFKQMERDAAIEFNEAMNACQAEIGRIAPDLNNPQTSSKYASYQALDRVLRPVYTRHGISLSFSEEDCPKADHVRIICYVSKGLHTRMYRKDMPVTTTGIKGNAMMTPTHATGAADSYARRYLLKDIFNVAIGECDTDGNGAEVDPGWAEERDERLAFFPKCSTLQELQDHWTASYKEAKAKKDTQAMDAFNFAKNKRKSELQGAK